MTWTYIVRTEHAKLRLTVEEPIDQEEWDALSAALTAWEPAVVSEGAATVTRLLKGLEKPPHEQMQPHAAEPERVIDWSAPMKDNNDTWRGPLDASVMGLRLAAGDTAVLTRSHISVHHNAMHRWVEDQPGSGKYSCGFGQCAATVAVESEPF